MLCLQERDSPLDLESASKVDVQNEHKPMVDGQDDAEDDRRAERSHNSEEDQEIAQKDDEDDNDDPELAKRLSKQRQRAIKAVHGRRKVIPSRNSYKDKGGRSSHNSKIQKQLSIW